MTSVYWCMNIQIQLRYIILRNQLNTHQTHLILFKFRHDDCADYGLCRIVLWLGVGPLTSWTNHHFVVKLYVLKNSMVFVTQWPVKTEKMRKQIISWTLTCKNGLFNRLPQATKYNSWLKQIERSVIRGSQWRTNRKRSSVLTVLFSRLQQWLMTLTIFSSLKTTIYMEHGMVLVVHIRAQYSGRV